MFIFFFVLSVVINVEFICYLLYLKHLKKTQFEKLQTVLDQNLANEFFGKDEF